MFVQWLSNTHSSPSTIKNYLSGAKNWVLEHCGSISGFTSYEVGQMLKSVSKHTQHVVRRAVPLFPSHLVMISAYCDATLAIPLSVKPCVLLGHALFLRASNLVSPSEDVWSGPHTLRTGDIKSFSDKLVVRISLTKTRVSPVIITVHVNPCIAICPVRAWNQYVATISPNRFGPAFIVRPGHPLTAKVVVIAMREALINDPSIDVSKVSMHSLRRGAAQSAAAAGVPTSQIMTAGCWASESGLKPYLIS